VEQLPGGLTVTYGPEGSAGIAELQVRAGVPPFAGAATGYFDDEDVGAFASAISASPPDTGRTRAGSISSRSESSAFTGRH
jgi:hypothetical protein